MNQPIVNDLVVRFANVNGTGSASANNIFSKAIFRMGLPVSPKNIFPSNIQGLPTWYEVRISEAGYLGRREGIDILVGINPQSLPKDIASLREGGYLVYDSSKKLHPDLLRSDIHYLGIPMMELAMQHFERPRTQQLLKNIIYLGAMAAFLEMEIDVIKDLISEQFAKKPKLVLPNHQALELGYNYAKDHYACPLPIRVARRDLVKGHIMMEGNAATGLGAIYAGATVAAWYPITPSTSVVQSFEKYANQLRIDSETGEKNFAVIQAEDELAAIGMVIGATWNGARAFTATSGPGVSLMSEFLGLAYYAEIPVVLVNVQRGGPSTGMPTRTQQADIISSAYASHGDTRHVLLFPSTPTECFEMAADAFDLAERLQTPVIVMSDLDLGMNFHMTPALKWEEDRTYDRGKVLSAEDLENMDQPFGRYLDVDGDGIPYRTFPGTHPSKGAFFTRGTSKDEYARYTESGEAYVRGVNRLIKKWNTAKEIVPRSELLQSSSQSETGIIFFGTSTYATEEALDQLRENGESVDALRIKAFPFDQTLEDFIAHHKRIFVIEQNRDAQMRTLLIAELDADPQKLIPLLNYDGMPITAARITAGLKGEKIPLKV